VSLYLRTSYVTEGANISNDFPEAVDFFTEYLVFSLAFAPEFLRLAALFIVQNVLFHKAWVFVAGLLRF